jgi:hypothetical protein
MFNQGKAEEQRYLESILNKLRKAFLDIDDKITNQAHEIREKKRYIWENLSQLDSVEKADNRIAVNNAITFGEKAIQQRQKLSKLIDSPYFGRVDFIRDGKNDENAFYIGIHNFAEESGNKILIYDWRAPISSLFYDFEAGRACYTAPAGKIGKDHFKTAVQSQRRPNGIHDRKLSQYRRRGPAERIEPDLQRAYEKYRCNHSKGTKRDYPERKVEGTDHTGCSGLRQNLHRPASGCLPALSLQRHVDFEGYADYFTEQSFRRLYLQCPAGTWGGRNR